LAHTGQRCSLDACLSSDPLAWRFFNACEAVTTKKAQIQKQLLQMILIIIIIIAPLTIVSDDQWGDLECLYKACQAARTVGGLFTDAALNEWDDDDE